MSIDAYLSRIKDRQGRQRDAPGISYPTPGNSENFTLTQGQSITITIPEWKVRCVAVTNLTPFFVHFPDNPVEWQWVPPNTIGAIYPVPPTGPIRVNAADVPGGMTVPTSTLTAQLTAHEDALTASAGAPFVSAASSIAANLSPNKRPLLIAFALASGASVQLVAPISGQTVYPFDWAIFSDAATAANPSVARLTDDAAAVIFAQSFAIAPGLMVAGKFSGAPLGLGLGLRLFNVGAVAATFYGYLTYSQA